MNRRRKAGRSRTDEEFRAVCENVAGVSLQELFEYASTTKAIDYDKYLGYAGLRLEEPVELPDARLGALAEEVEGKLVVAAPDALQAAIVEDPAIQTPAWVRHVRRSAALRWTVSLLLQVTGPARRKGSTRSTDFAEVAWENRSAAPRRTVRLLLQVTGPARRAGPTCLRLTPGRRYLNRTASI